MDTVMRRCVQHVFQRTELMNELCVDPKLVDQVKAVHQSEHPRCEAKQHNGCIEYPVQNSAKPALANGDAEVVVLAGMVHDVEIPEEPAFVAYSMEDVIHQVVHKEQCDPGPPRIGRKLVRRHRITDVIDINICKGERESPCDANEPDENISPRVAFVAIFARASSTRPVGFD